MQSEAEAWPDSDSRQVPATPRRIEARGKFFFAGEEKLFLKGVTYGPFAPASHGAAFPEQEVVARDFALMAELGANSLRTFTVPPRWLLDLAAAHGLKAMIGIPWAQYLCFLDSPALISDIRRTIARAVTSCRDHPAAAAYLIGNEIPPDIVRWYRPRRIQAFLKDLVGIAKDIDPHAPVGYANFPSTEYLETEFTDFLAFKVYLHDEEEFRRYLPHLHTLAGARPLVLTEFGIDSTRESAKGQARMLSGQVRATFELGAAGAFVFTWTDDRAPTPTTSRGGDGVDRAFGLVDREGKPKPAFYAVQRWYNPPLPPVLNDYPKVSVVVCAYNAERTINDCLASLDRLQYPYYEVIVVNDGSTDRTPEILQRYDSVRVLHQEENRGLSEARNVGLAAAAGEIVAYTDADCVVDPDWLTYVVATFLSSGRAAVGGPNLSPSEDSLVASCVAVAPGGPMHVLLDDEEAEHIPGCNMAFRREALEEIGGFDPIFRAAGDDVDVCWRLQDKGHTIGFSPAAQVWHYRRHTVGAYLSQQRGYGKAEALLYFTHPQRVNLLGSPDRRGQIYGGGVSSVISLGREPVYSGIFGRGLVQTLYRRPASLLAQLPFTLEWNLIAAMLFVYALGHGGYAWAGVLPLLVSWGGALTAAFRAPVAPRNEGLKGRLLIALLTYLGPLARSLERYRWRIRGLTAAEPITSDRAVQTLPISWRGRAFSVAYWTEAGLEKEGLLRGVTDVLLRRKYFVVVDQGWSDWDLEVHGGIWSKARIKVCAEHHGGEKRLFRVKCALKLSQLAAGVLSACLFLAAASLALKMPALALGAAGAAAVGATATLNEGLGLGRMLYEVLQGVARRARLHYAPRKHGSRAGAR